RGLPATPRRFPRGALWPPSCLPFLSAWWRDFILLPVPQSSIRSMRFVTNSARWGARVLALLVVSPCVLGATGRVECNSVPSKILARGVPYCIVLPAAFDADKSRHFPVLYALH